MTCTTCEHAERTGWYGTNNPHCNKCHRDWRGTAQMHCVTCCAHFTSVSACNAHETSYGCTNPAGARNKQGRPIFQLLARNGGLAWALTGDDRHTWPRAETR